MNSPFRPGVSALVAIATFAGSAAAANDYRERGKPVQIVNSPLRVVPPRDWNRLSARPGKYAETWTLDGEQLNDLTFYVGVESGKPLVREGNKKRDPLPKFTSTTLLAEVPELLEGTYRTYKKIGAFKLVSTTPDRFLGRDGVRFAYEYTDSDDLPRKGEARAALIGGKLYMATFDAPRLHFFDTSVADFRALTDTAVLGS